MEVKAYLLAKLTRIGGIIAVDRIQLSDTAEPPLTATREAPSVWAILLEASGTDYDAARLEVLKKLRESPTHGWLKPYFEV